MKRSKDIFIEEREREESYYIKKKPISKYMKIECNKDHPIHPANIEMVENPNGTGLTKREYFAAMAMKGIISSSPQSAMTGYPQYTPKNVSEMAIEYADNLIQSLNK